MSVSHETVTDPLLAAVLDLSPMATGELDDSSRVQRILVALEEMLPGCDARLCLIDNGRMQVCKRSPDAPRADLMGTVLESPEIRAWLLGTRDEVIGLTLPESIAKVARIDASKVESRLLVGAKTFLGVLLFRRDTLSVQDGTAVSVLTGYGAAVLENARLYRRLEVEAETDGLTDAFNYRFFMRALGVEMARVRRHGAHLSVLMVDVDDLKGYNELHGHLGGSAALRELARILESCCRAIDIVAKYGGDEFCILLPSCDVDGADVCAERALEAVRGHHFEGDSERRLTVSIGIACFPDEGNDERDLLRCADMRLFEAKRAGRNRTCGRS